MVVLLTRRGRRLIVRLRLLADPGLSPLLDLHSDDCLHRLLHFFLVQMGRDLGSFEFLQHLIFLTDLLPLLLDYGLKFGLYPGGSGTG